MVLIFAHLYFSGSSVALHQLADEFSPIGRQLPPPSSLHAHISSRVRNAVAFPNGGIFGRRANGEANECQSNAIDLQDPRRVDPRPALPARRLHEHLHLPGVASALQHIVWNWTHHPRWHANRSKVTAYNIFADWMNERNPALQLTGRGLSHRLTSYKRLYTNAKNHEDPSCNEVDKGHRKDSHTEILEQLCPCFERMDHIFGNQVDISPILLSDQPLRDSGIITVTNWLAGHTFLSLAKVFLVLAFIILLTTHIPLSFW
ncbi:hypothetical protein PSTT_01453 [Puccinia striiformis]|uniref:Uncharacterized protein n=1 Tax=Puccinia striiformis TaxID=27350 RepID=A0A2S4W3I9_9BASI|nr:hypothetical protein PSTT_01453 [Puccinia striiformis]